MIQFALISLIPGLLRRLEDCADPEFDSYEKKLVAPTSLKTSERSSCRQKTVRPIELDVLADYGTKSYIVGSTNSLLLQQKDRYSDILINLDETTVSITSASLRSALTLSAADRRWIDFLSQTVTDTWDEANPSRPCTMGYMGSEEFIRLQFEEYILALLASVKYHIYLTSSPTSAPTPLPTIEGDPTTDFGPDWIHAWRQTASFTLFNTHTDTHLFDIVEPRHPTAGNLSLEDIQRRLALQIQTLHLDDRLATSKEALNRHLATGQKKVSTAFTNLWADIEALREAQLRKRAETSPTSPTRNLTSASGENARGLVGGINPAAAHASVAAAGQKAGAYLSSWGTWAADKRKGWGRMGSSGDLRGAAVAAPGREKSWGRKEAIGGDGIGRLDA
ncbi:MAG: hypothetical protein Q9195_007979 [Heterodermia aff. obscurata]